MAPDFVFPARTCLFRLGLQRYENNFILQIFLQKNLKNFNILQLLSNFAKLKIIMENLTYISVILPLKLDWEPCYSLPIPGSTRPAEDVTLWNPEHEDVDRKQEDIVPETGMRVTVRFGKNTYVGVISAVGIEPDIDKKKIRPIVKFETDLEKVSPAEIRFWRVVADYYLCTTGEVYKAAYPSFKLDQEKTAARIENRKAEQRQKVLDAAATRLSKLEARLAAKTEKLETTTGPKARQTLETGIVKLKEELKMAREAYDRLSSTGTENGTASSAGTENGTGSENSDAHPGARLSVTRRPLEALSPGQEKARQEIRTAFAEGHPALLKGVTGSGKTEIYMHLAEEALKKQRNVLYLVPEIAMSMQLESRLHEFFGERLLVFHSKENLLSKRQTAERLRAKGAPWILLGTRSALFLPVHDLGLIIVDEEHDNSYKQDAPEPKYNGRDTALMLSRLQDGPCHVVLGSATPSLESLYNCACGKYRKVELNEKFFKGTLPEIEIIDTIAERKKRGMVGNFSRKLIAAITSTLARKEQVIILRARRSYAPVLQCQECGDILKCPHCNVSMSWNKSSNKMICHYCGHTEDYDGKCAKCGGELRNLGAGTQKIEEEAIQLFPQARIARLDSDAAQNKNYETRVIGSFAEGHTDILIGTQMIAKGFDFENVTLVVLLQADAILGLQDFRADEKAMQLMEQLRGRCGRREKQGRFLIQTSQSAHPLYTQLMAGQAGELYDKLLCERRDFRFPPFTRIILIEVRDKSLQRIEWMTTELARQLRANGADLEGPFPPAISKVADWHLRCLRINLPKDRNLAVSKRKLYRLIEDFSEEKKYMGHIALNVDPI